jgi:Zn-dependent peptidase ImmA (M78 family)/transcriptional regulator with XRE-family HTH domain
MNRDELLVVRRLFDGQRLEQARELRGMLKSELAQEVRLTAAAIGQFESQADYSSTPSAATIASLSLALGVPPAFFAAGRPRIDLREEDVHFRSLRSTSKRDRTQARAQVRLLAEIVGVLGRSVRLPVAGLPELPTGMSPAEVAAYVRESWHLGDGPIADVVGLLERKGVIVTRLPAATDELDAFSCSMAGRPYVVLTTNKGAADRSRFDAAHELFHLLAHHDASPGDPKLEAEANQFAAAFLMPESAIVRELPARLDWRSFAELKLRWRVSIAALLMRSRDLGVMSDEAYRRGMMEMSRRGWRRNEPVDLGPPEQPVLLARALDLLAQARGYTMNDLAADVALPREVLEPFRLTLEAPTVPEVALP